MIPYDDHTCPKDHTIQLSTDVKILIMSHITFKDIINLRLTCKHWRIPTTKKNNNKWGIVLFNTWHQTQCFSRF